MLWGEEMASRRGFRKREVRDPSLPLSRVCHSQRREDVSYRTVTALLPFMPRKNVIMIKNLRIQFTGSDSYCWSWTMSVAKRKRPDQESAHNSQRMRINQYSQVTIGVRKSLQPCKVADNRALIDLKQAKVQDASRVRNLSALRYILDCLTCKADCNGRKVSLAFMTFQEAFDIYRSFLLPGEVMCTEDVHLKAELRNLLCHVEYGLCVYLLQRPKREEVIVLRPDSVDLCHFLCFLVQDEVDVQERAERKAKMVVNKKFCQDLMSVVETEWDKRVMRV